MSQTGRVYVETSDRIWEIPTTANAENEREFATEPPKLFFKVSPLNNLLELSSLRRGGGLSFVHEQGAPEGEGTIYAYGHVKLDEPARGVLAFKYVEHEGAVTLSELGWTGGQTPGSNKGECALAIEGEPSVAGGSGGDVFVFDPDPPPFGEELTAEANPHVTGFGLGGRGCPTASASKPSATVEGAEAEGSVTVGKPVTLSSEVAQANALSVQWRFENLTTHEVETTPLGGNEYQKTSVEHTFDEEGEYKVTEIIHTDNFAEPTLEETATLIANGNALQPTARFNYPASAVVNDSATFKAHVSDPSGDSALPLEYVWKFGDNSETVVGKTSAVAFSVSHAYQTPGRYTVTLTITDKFDHKAEESHEVLVEASKEEHKEVTGGGGNVGGGNAGGGQNASGGKAGGGNAGGGQNTGGGVTGVRAVNNPDVTLTGTSFATSLSGALKIKVTCPSESRAALVP